MSDSVPDVSMQIGDARVSDILAAVKPAAAAHISEAEKLVQRLGASEARADQRQIYVQ